MKKLITLFCVLLMSVIQLSAQPAYLVNKCAVTDSDQRCKIYKYNGQSSPRIIMAGGMTGRGGLLFGEKVPM